MSSDESDIDLECQKIIKPRKFTPKLMSNITVDQVNVFSSNSQQQTQHTNNRSNDNSRLKSKFEKKKPIATQILQKKTDKNKKGVKIDQIKITHFQSTSNSQVLTFFGSSSQKMKNKPITFMEDLFCHSRDENDHIFQNGQSLDLQDKIFDPCERNIKNTKKAIKKNMNQTQLQSSGTLFREIKRTQIIKDYCKQGNVIRTAWSQGLINGFTEIDYEDGGKFRGIFQTGQMISGQITFPNQFIYTGEFSMFTFHGNGKLKYPNGVMFQGNWILGNLCGKGTIRYPKGQMYYGQIQNFKRHGQGYLYFQNGDKYSGQFKNGHITGFGQFYSNGQIQKKGFWIKGKYIGPNLEDFKRNYHRNEDTKEKLQKPKLKKNSSLKKARFTTNQEQDSKDGVSIRFQTYDKEFQLDNFSQC